MKTYKFQTIIEINDEDAKVDIIFTLYKGSKETRFEPASDPEIDIESVKLDGKEMEVSLELNEKLIEECWKYLEDLHDAKAEYLEDNYYERLRK